MSDDRDFSHQSGIFDPSTFMWSVHIIGVGTIGSNALFGLMHLGIQDITIWDTDIVEPHNVNAQPIYTLDDVDTPKVEAAAAFAARFGSTVTPRRELVTADTPLEGVVVCGVDSMSARQDIWNGVRFNPDVALFIDGRIGGEEITMLTVAPCDLQEIECYEETLHSDEDAFDDPCGERSIIHPGQTLGGMITTQVTVFNRQLQHALRVTMHLPTFQIMVAHKQPDLAAL